MLAFLFSDIGLAETVIAKSACKTNSIKHIVSADVTWALMASFTATSVRKLKINFHEDCDMNDAFLNSVIRSRFWNISVHISFAVQFYV